VATSATARALDRRRGDASLRRAIERDLTVGGKVTDGGVNHDSVGATLTINGAATTLAAGVDTLAP